MNIDFEKFNDDIKNYFITNLPGYIDTINSIKTDLVVPYPSKYEIDLVDPVKNTEKVVFYIIPYNYTFLSVSNESENMRADIKIVITFAKDKGETLYKYAHRYANAVYSMIENDNSFSNVVDYTEISNINYDAEITQAMQAIVIDIIVNKEI